jgi:hypothetical protein
MVVRKNIYTRYLSIYSPPCREGPGVGLYQQLLTLITDRHDMYFADILLAEVFDGFAPVEHRRKLDDDTVSFLY